MDKDREVLIKTLSSFDLYRPSLHAANQLRRTDYISLKAAHKSLLPQYLETLEKIDEAIELNDILVKEMLRHGSTALLDQPWQRSLREAPSSGDLEKIRATVKQTVRDWSLEGSLERDLTYLPILKILEEEYTNETNRRTISVLTPGCGLGRLPFEIARLGFDSVGNEFSYHMLTASHYLLNCVTEIGQHSIAPYVHSMSNHFNQEDMFRRVSIPDVVPADALSNASFSMAAGEFVECFHDAESEATFDCVITCFFLDTAHNVIDYIETIRHALKDDGLWINLGPCLWHHEHGQNRTNKLAFDDEGDYVGSIELSMHEVMDLVRQLDFTIEHESTIDTPYMGNAKAMLEHTYHAKLFTARRSPR